MGSNPAGAIWLGKSSLKTAGNIYALEFEYLFLISKPWQARRDNSQQD